MGDSNTFVLYRYTPSLPAAIIFSAFFLVTTALHIFQAAKRRTFYFIPLIVGGICQSFRIPPKVCMLILPVEFGGYVARGLAHSNKDSLNIYIVQILLLLVAPALFAASIYMVLGRLIIFTQGEAMSPIRARWLTKIFVCGDIFSFLVQSGGTYYVSAFYLTMPLPAFFGSVIHSYPKLLIC